MYINCPHARKNAVRGSAAHVCACVCVCASVRVCQRARAQARARLPARAFFAQCPIPHPRRRVASTHSRPRSCACVERRKGGGSQGRRPDRDGRYGINLPFVALLFTSAASERTNSGSGAAGQRARGAMEAAGRDACMHILFDSMYILYAYSESNRICIFCSIPDE